MRMLKAIIMASVALVAPSAVAYHDTVDTVRSSGSISAILPIAVVVVLGLVWLGILDQKKRKRVQNVSTSPSDGERAVKSC